MVEWTALIMILLMGLLLLTSVDSQNVCHIQNVIMGRHFHPHPTECTKYLQCVQRSGGWFSPQARDCPPGLFWDVFGTTCRIPNQLRNPCTSDPCFAQGVGVYAAKRHCRGYFTCSGSVTSELFCCERGQKFNAVTEKCETDILRDCDDICTDEPTTTTYPCRLTRFPMSERLFYEAVPMHGIPVEIIKTCPVGSAFVEADCGCTKQIAAEGLRGCTPSLAVNFMGRRIKDMFGNHIVNLGVGINAQFHLGLFSGRSRLVIPRYSNHFWGDEFVVVVAFATQGIRQSDAVIFSNSGCVDELPSVKIAIQNNTLLEGSVVLENGDKARVIAPFLPSGINLAYFVYDGTLLSLAVLRPDSIEETDTRRISGNVAMKKCAAQVGYATESNFFIGFIDMLQVLVCN